MAYTRGANIIELDGGVAVRPLRDDDVKSYSLHGNNKKIWDNLRDRMPHPYTEVDAKSWIDFLRTPEAHARSGRWTKEGGAEGPSTPTGYAITVDDEAVGSIAVTMGTDVYFRTGEIGYWLGEAYWGRGIMSRVVPAFVEWVWQTFGVLVRLNGETYERNVASEVLLKKAGFQFEGRRPNAAYKNAEIVSICMFGALRPASLAIGH